MRQDGKVLSASIESGRESEVNSLDSTYLELERVVREFGLAHATQYVRDLVEANFHRLKEERNKLLNTA